MAGCQRCGRSSTAPSSWDILEELPQEAQALVVVPNLHSLGEKWALLEKRKVASLAAQLNGFKTAAEYSQALMKQLGVDVRSREAMEQAGLWADAPLAFVLLENGQNYLVIYVKKEAAFRAFLGDVAQKRLAAGKVSERREKDATWVTYLGPDAAPRLGAVFRRGVAFVGAGPGMDALSTAAFLPAEKRLKQQAQAKRSLARLPQEKALFGRVRPKAPSRDVYWSASLSEGGLEVVLESPRPTTASVQALESAPPIEWEGLPSDAFVVARYADAPTRLWPWLQSGLGASLTKAAEQARFDMKAEVLDNLKPGATLAVALSPQIRMDRGLPGVDPRKANPSQWVHVVLSAPVADREKATSTLEKLPRIAPVFSAEITREEEKGLARYVTRYAQGEGLHFALLNENVVAAAPLERLDRILANHGEGRREEGPLSPGLRAEFERGRNVLVVDLQRLAKAVTDLPTDAWGIGGFAIKATTQRWLEAASDLRAVTLNVDDGAEAIRAEVKLHLENR